MLLKYRKRRALTLVEILIVMGIIGILAAISLAVVARARKHEAQLRLDACKANMRKIADSLEAYKVSNGFYPVLDTLMDSGKTMYMNIGDPDFCWIGVSKSKAPVCRCPLSEGPGGYRAFVTYDTYEIFCHCSHEEAGYANGYPRYKKVKGEPAPRWFNDAQAK